MFTLLEKQTIFNLLLDYAESKNIKLTVQSLNNIATELGMNKCEFEDFCNNLTNLDKNSIVQGLNGIYNNKNKRDIYDRIMKYLK
jgi:hypothetical protein